MPLYDFECEDCKNIFEELVINTKNYHKLCCPKCGSKTIKKLVSLFGVAGTEKKVSTTSCHSCSTKDCSTCKE